MDKLKFYQLAAGFLLLLNFSMIAFQLLVRHPRSPRGNPAIKLLKMDGEQIKDFGKLVEQHRAQMKTIHGKQQELLKPYFNNLVDSSGNDREVFLSQVLELERKKIEATYQHFKDTKSLLKPEQYAGFEKFMERALRRILEEQKNKPKRPKDSR